MVENPDFNNEPNLPVRLNRREFLKLAAATAGSFMLTVCGVRERKAAARECPVVQRLEVPNSYINDLKEAIAPLTKLMRPATVGNLTIEVAKTKPNFLHGCNLPRNKEIRVLLPDASQQMLEFGKTIAFHETAHLFNSSNNRLPSRYLKEEMEKRTGRNKYTLNEYKNLHEASYSDLEWFRNYVFPPGSSDFDIMFSFPEVFPGTITVLRFYPSEFIEKLEKLNNPESKRLLATSGLVCIDALKKFSAIPVEYSDLPFDPNLVAYLIQEGQNSVS